MVRQARIEYEGALYHVISRGERLEKIFFDDKDKLKFLEKLGEAADKFNFKTHCYVLMDNHFHLLLETPEGNLSRAMHYLNTSYSNWFKSKHQIIGSIFQGRYKSILIEKEMYLLMLSVYIHLNPVRARLVNSPERYRWSSFKDYMRNDRTTSLVFSKDILKMFSDDKERYREFVHSYIVKDNEIKKEDIRGEYSILGGKKFRDEVSKKLKSSCEESNLRELPDLKGLSRLDKNEIKKIILKAFLIKEEELLIKKRNNCYRKLYLYGLKRYTDLSIKNIADLCEVDYAAASQMIKRFILDSEKNYELKLMVKKLDREVRNY